MPDFHGGDDNFTSIDYMAIPYPPMKALAALIVDGVLDRFPRLKFGVIEQGASWVPGWMRNMDSAHNAFYKNEERLQKMSLQAQRVRAPPGPRHALSARGRRLDHRQLGRRGLPVLVGLPARRGRPQSDQALRGVDGSGRHQRAQKQRFYCDNFVDLMGAGLAPELRPVA